MSEQMQTFEVDRSKYDNPDSHKPKFVAVPGLNEDLVREISKSKSEPEWMLQKRLKALELFNKTKVPTWGPDLSDLKFEEIVYYIRPDAKESESWDEVPEEIKKTFERLGIPEAERTALAGAGAQYDCLTADTKVFTNPKGARNISDVQIGDTVFALDEKRNEIVTSKVQAVIDKGKRPVFKVRIRGKEIKATYNHPFLTLVDRRKDGRQRSRFSKEWRYLNELQKGDIIAVATDLPDTGKPHVFSKPVMKRIVQGSNQFGAKYDLDISSSYNKVIYPHSSTDDIMWLFGFFLGDGYITQPKNKDKKRLNFAIHEKDKEVRDKVKEVIKENFGYTIKTEDTFRISVNATLIADFFKKNGFYGNSREKEIPQWVFKIPKEQKKHLIAGYIDADGTVREKNKDAVLTSVNKKLLEQIKELIVYCGIDSSKITSFVMESGKDCYRIQLTGRTKYLPCVHPMKKGRLLSKILDFGRKNSLQGTTIRKYCSESVGFSRIEDITYCGEESVYDLTIENHHNFVANGVVVHNSEVVYHKIQKKLKDQGVIFENMDVALQKYRELVKKYFMTNCIPITDHKFIMLHGAVWSGGTFIYVPKGVKVDLPLQAYFRMNSQMGGQFEHTLIVVDEGAELHYIEGCSSPRYQKNSIHAGCVEIYVEEGAKMRYSSVENWSKNVYNLNTKRAIVKKNAKMEWINGNNGSKSTMLYPCSVLVGEGASTDNLGIAFANTGQNQDTGSKVIHAAPNTTSTIIAKSISKGGGITSYRGSVQVTKSATNAKCSVKCDALIIDGKSKSNTYPFMNIETNKVNIAHEASVGKIGEEEVFYLMSRGLSEEEAVKMVVSGFTTEITKKLPLEYAVELNKLIELEMERRVG